MKLKDNFTFKRINDRELINVELSFIILIVTINTRLKAFVRKVSLIKRAKSIMNR